MTTLIEQLEAMRTLAENWDGYGAASPSPAAIELATEFVGLLEALNKVTSKLSTSNVSPARNGGVLIEWEDATRQHEVEINPDASISFLHLDKVNGQIETHKFSSGPLHPGLLHELRRLLAA
jgi:hypothetical protein